MKALILTLITTASLFAQAKGGGNQPMTPNRFMEESLEYSIILAKNAGAGVIATTSAQVVDAETIQVMVTNNSGTQYNFQCLLVDDFSKGGTLVKKDIRCSAL